MRICRILSVFDTIRQENGVHIREDEESFFYQIVRTKPKRNARSLDERFDSTVHGSLIRPESISRTDQTGGAFTLARQYASISLSLCLYLHPFRVGDGGTKGGEKRANRSLSARQPPSLDRFRINKYCRMIDRCASGQDITSTGPDTRLRSEEGPYFSFFFLFIS